MRKEAKERIIEIIVREGNRPATAESVVAEAADPQSVLHPYFEWDDAAAGHAYRINQARVYIRRVKVTTVVKDTQVWVPFARRDHTLPHKVQGYRATVSVVGVAPDYAAMLRRELGQALAYLNRAAQLAAGAGRPIDIERAADEIRALMPEERDDIAAGPDRPRGETRPRLEAAE